MTKTKFDVYEAVTAKIVAAMEQGGAQWLSRWNHADGGQPVAMPKNATTGKPYRGINVLALWCSAMDHGFASGTWATFKQWKAAGASVRKGEKSTMVVFWKFLDREREKPNGETETYQVPMARYYLVFNADQVEGWKGAADPAPELSEHDRDQAADDFLAATGATINHGGNQAFYAPGPDRIQMPHLGQFVDSNAYYATVLHELTHWTAPEKRANRPHNYANREERAMEELTAELGAAFLCATLGLSPTPRDDHAAYLASWIKALKHDKRAIFTAASAAQRAADYCWSLQPAAVDQAA